MMQRLLQELGEELGLRSWKAETGRPVRFVLEGGNETYVLDAEPRDTGLLLGLGVQCPQPEFDELAQKAATIALKHEGLKAVRLENRLYFMQTVPPAATPDVLHQTLNRCLECQRELRR